MDISTKWIPQRYPFTFIDQIYELSDEYAKSKRVVTTNDSLTLSGSYLIENMVQTASALFGYRNRNQIPDEMYLAGIDTATIHRCPKPGECLETEVKLVIAAGKFARVSCQCFVTGTDEPELICEGSFVLAV